MATIRDNFDTNSPYKLYSNIIYSKKTEKIFVGIPFFDKNLKKERSGDVFYIIKPSEEGRPDILSYKFYNTTDLDWLICYYNNIKDPFKELVAGKKIIIPDPEEVSIYLFPSPNLIDES